jgi:thioredoxin 1
MNKLFLFVIFISIFCCSKVEDNTSEPSSLLTVNDEATFDSKVKTGVSLVFFHATWCTKCAAQRPAVENLVTNTKLKDVKFVQVDYEKNSSIASKTNVIGFPTILLLKDGVEKQRYETTGISSNTLEQKLLELLK